MTSNSSDHVPTQSSVRAYVDNNLSALVNSAPETLDTLNELCTFLDDNPNFFYYCNNINREQNFQKMRNLSDLTNVSTARTNLGSCRSR